LFRAIHNLVNSARTQLEAINYTLAEALYTRSGKGNMDGSFERDRRLWSNELRVKLAEILPNDAKLVQQAFEDAQNESPETANGKAILDFFNKHHADIKKANPNYTGQGMPIVLDMIAIDGDRKGFAEILRKGGIKNPQEITQDLFAGRGMADYSINHGAGRPKGVRRRNEEFAIVYQALKEAGFVDNDAPSVLNRFIESSTAYATWSRIFGSKTKNGKFDENAFFDHLIEKTHPTKRGEALKIVQAITHTMEPAPHWINVGNSVAFAFHAATILWFSGIASFPEAASIVGRARGDVNGLGKDLSTIFSKTKRAEAAKLVAEFEVFTAGMQRHALHKLYGDGDLTTGKASQTISETVFKLNGQELLLEGMYHFATQTAHRYLESHVDKAIKGDKKSIRALKELGASVDDAKAYVIYKKSDGGAAIPPRIKKAIQLFVDESISNPHVSQMPTWMSDPRFQIFATFKKFFYAFWENNHRQIYAEGKARGLSPSAMVPAAMAIAFALPLAAASEYLRELLKYPFGRPGGKEVDPMDKLMGTLLATGFLGPMHSAQAAYEQRKYGRNFAVSVAGPTPSLMYEIITGRSKVSRFVPIASQQGDLRKIVDDGVRNLTGSGKE
jgi:hypothetical protein